MSTEKKQRQEMSEANKRTDLTFIKDYPDNSFENINESKDDLCYYEVFRKDHPENEKINYQKFGISFLIT
jgi:hypothetical protein